MHMNIIRVWSLATKRPFNQAHILTSLSTQFEKHGFRLCMSLPVVLLSPGIQATTREQQLFIEHLPYVRYFVPLSPLLYTLYTGAVLIYTLCVIICCCEFCLWSTHSFSKKSPFFSDHMCQQSSLTVFPHKAFKIKARYSSLYHPFFLYVPNYS